MAEAVKVFKPKPKKKTKAKNVVTEAADDKGVPEKSDSADCNTSQTGSLEHDKEAATALQHKSLFETEGNLLSRQEKNSWDVAVQDNVNAKQQFTSRKVSKLFRTLDTACCEVSVKETKYAEVSLNLEDVAEDLSSNGSAKICDTETDSKHGEPSTCWNEDVKDSQKHFVVTDTTENIKPFIESEEQSIDSTLSAEATPANEFIGTNEDQSTSENKFSVEASVAAVTMATAPELSLEVECASADGQSYVTKTTVGVSLLSTPLFTDQITKTSQVGQLNKVYSESETMAGTRLYPALSTVKEKINLKPYTDAQLRSLYYNEELESCDSLTEHFIEKHRQENLQSHPFYELLMNFFRARNNLKAAEEDYKSLEKEHRRLAQLLWDTTEHTLPIKGVCECKTKVQGLHKYEMVKFNQENHPRFTENLKKIRTQVHEVLTLHAYSAQLSWLQIESYIHELFSGSVDLREIPYNAPVQALPKEKCHYGNEESVQALHVCISILFSMQRKPSSDKGFTDITREWLSRMVGALLRIASFDDHVFLLNHVLRCPSGFGKWAAPFVQVLPPSQSVKHGQLLQDHCLAILHIILSPIREEYLNLLKCEEDTSPDPHTKNKLWVLLDSEGEEDEENEHLLAENDIVALLNQTNFGEIFRFAFKFGPEMQTYNIHDTSEQSMLMLMSFATCIIKILGQGLEQFKLRRYKQLNKRLGHMICETVQYISDHWTNFRDTFEASEHRKHLLPRLQVEYDSFFGKATLSLFSAKKLGAWQFMVDMPHSSISSGMMWLLLRQLILTNDQVLDVEKDTRDILWEMQDHSIVEQFVDKLQQMPQQEVIYLLTTFSKMAVSREAESDMPFIDIVLSIIYEVSFIDETMRQFCSKAGRDLIATMTETHVTIVSSLLQKVSKQSDREMTLYLFHGIDLLLWQPSIDDVELVRDWLLKFPLMSVENQLARLVLSKMNWGINREGTDLFLQVDVHREIAVLLTQAYIQYIPESKPGLVYYSIQQLYNASSLMWSEPAQEQQFYTWTWSLAHKLRLHLYSQPKMEVYPESLASSFSEASMERRKSFLSDVPTLNDMPQMSVVERAVRDKCVFASYIALMMSKAGHDMAYFLSDGLSMLNQLVDNQQYIAAVNVLSCVTPLFYDTPQYIATNERFLAVIKAISSGDQTFTKMAKNLFSPEFPAKVLRTFSAMILSQVMHYESIALMIVQFWLKQLTSISNWQLDRNVVYLVDCLIAVSFKMPGGFESIVVFFTELYKAMIQKSGVSDKVNSILSWVTSGNVSRPSLLPKSSYPEFPYFAYIVLTVETAFEKDVWNSLQKELSKSNTVPVETCLKRACSSLKVTSPPLGQLAIYRWAQQAYDTAIGHPILPVIWQQFFALYLQRTHQPTGSPSKPGNGQRFFESMINSAYLKKLRRRLTATADEYSKLIANASSNSENRDDSPSSRSSVKSDYQADVSVCNQLYKIFYSYSLWLNEPRLHDPSLYLPALPEQYSPHALAKIFQVQQKMWVEYVDMKKIDHTIKQLIRVWKVQSGQFVEVVYPVDTVHSSAAARILGRLKLQSNVVPPPPVVSLKPPIPDVSVAMVLNKDAVLSSVKGCLQLLVECARNYVISFYKHVELDASYQELILHQYDNQVVETAVEVPCQKYRPRHKCKGPAEILVKIEVKSEDPVTKRKLESNREESKQLLFECEVMRQSHNACKSAVHIENIITKLVKVFTGPDICNETQLKNTGAMLFYLLVSYITEDTQQYPPTSQFFTSCVEMLGQEFIAGDMQQTRPLLETILSSPRQAGLLSPHFSPNGSPTTFEQLYLRVIESSWNDNSTVAFMLLTKFDVWQWLSDNKPTLTQRTHFLNTVVRALYMSGLTADQEMQIILAIYRKHLVQLLEYQFPDLYGSVLQALLMGVENQSLDIESWNEFLRTMGCDPVSGESMVTNCKLQFDQLRDTMEVLSTFFLQLRLSSSTHMMFGLYSRLPVYVFALANWLGFISENYISSVKEQSSQASAISSHSKVVDELWRDLIDLYAPWIQPLQGEDTLWPWIDSDTMYAAQVVLKFTKSVQFLLDQFPDNCSMILELAWQYYSTMLSSVSVAEHFLNTYHAHFITLPWEKYLPSLEDFEMMLKVRECHPPAAASLVGHLMTKFPWQQIMDKFLAHDTPAVVSRLLSTVLSILVQLSCDKYLMESTDLRDLLDSACTFPWEYLDVASYETATKWYRTNCDPVCVIADSSEKIAGTVRLLKAAARISSTDEQLSEDSRQKYAIYIRCLIQMLCDIPQKEVGNNERLMSIFTALITEMEAVAVTGTDPSCVGNYFCYLWAEVMTTLNFCNNQNSLKIFTSALNHWITKCKNDVMLCSVITACRHLADIQLITEITEVCIESFFTQDHTDSEQRGWMTIQAALPVPELTKSEFVNSCIRHHRLLTLYAYVLQWQASISTLQDEFEILDYLMQWLKTISVLPEGETKSLLLAGKVLDLVCRQLYFTVEEYPRRHSLKVIEGLVERFTILGEDKASSGILGIIGLGKRSSLSIRFRFICRALAAFLAAQIPANQQIRLNPGAPGCVKDLSRPSSPLGADVSSGHPSDSAQQLLEQLRSVVKNRVYAEVRGEVSNVIEYITDADHCMQDAQSFLWNLVSQHFCDTYYLLILQPL